MVIHLYLLTCLFTSVFPALQRQGRCLCEPQISLARQSSCWTLILEKILQISTKGPKFAFSLESACCRKRYRPRSFADITTAFFWRTIWMKNPEVVVLIHMSGREEQGTHSVYLYSTYRTWFYRNISWFSGTLKQNLATVVCINISLLEVFFALNGGLKRVN